jgi:hypothetical protein
MVPDLHFWGKYDPAGGNRQHQIPTSHLPCHRRPHGWRGFGAGIGLRRVQRVDVRAAPNSSVDKGKLACDSRLACLTAVRSP